MKYCILIWILILFVACRNPFSNNPTEKNDTSYAIGHTEDGEILLRLHPKEGDKTNLQMEVNMQPEGMLVSLDTHFIGDLKMRVQDINSSENLYAIDFQRIQFETAVLGTQISYDSQGDNNNLPQQLQDELQSLLANKIEMTIDSLAHIKSIAFNQQTTEMTAKTVDLNFLFIPLPVDPVQVGDRWSVSQDVQNIKDLALFYSIEKISAAEVLVLVSSEKDEVKGQYIIDRKTGFTKKAKLDIHAVENGKGLQMQVRLHAAPTI